jgi:hypothetical protein
MARAMAVRRGAPATRPDHRLSFELRTCPLTVAGYRSTGTGWGQRDLAKAVLRFGADPKRTAIAPTSRRKAPPGRDPAEGARKREATMIRIMMIVILMSSFAIAARAQDPAQGAASQAERTRQACLQNDLLRTAYDCGCVAEKANGQKVQGAWNDAFNDLINSEEVRPCIRPDSIRAESLLNCGRGYRLHRILDRKKMGKASFCHCVTDATLERLPQTSMKSVPTLASGSGDNRALLQCGKLASYPVPADSIFRPVTPKPVPTLADDVRLRTDDQTIFLIVVNKNFEIGKLDHARYAVSDAWNNKKPNDTYVTPKENPVGELPQAILTRGAKAPGKIEPRNPEDVVDMAHLYNSAILVRAPQLADMRARIERTGAISSADYYLVSGDQVYAVPDPAAHLDAS